VPPRVTVEKQDVLDRVTALMEKADLSKFVL
jgi:hypothetical protein